MPLNSKHANLPPKLLSSVTRQYGAPFVAKLPRTDLLDDPTDDFAKLHALLDGKKVVLFPSISPCDLDGFFRLRLIQVLDERPPLQTLSVVVLSADRTGRLLADGFADRFSIGWPFDQCVFLTDDDDHEALSWNLGVAVAPVEDPVHPPEILYPDAGVSQKIALHLQPSSNRCGNTILFENQIEDLVQSGFLTIRVFTDAQWRRGETLKSMLNGIVRENSTHAGAHINVVAVPDGPPTRLLAEDPSTTWRNRLTAMSGCRLYDDAVVQAANQAECVIANHPECIGPALSLSPYARLLLAFPEDQAVSDYRLTMLRGFGETVALQAAAATTQMQTHTLGIADICSFVSAAEMTDLAPYCRRSVGVLPRVYAVPSSETATPRFDLMLVGSEHPMNIVSLRWFLDQVWRPYLEPRSVSVAIIGRIGDLIDDTRFSSPLLHVLGFVEELEAVRSWCRLTLVPDKEGAGISIKMLTTLAAGHPVVTTRIGLRGLSPLIAEALPAFDTADMLAADILGLLGSSTRLAERRCLVRQVREAADQSVNHAALVMTVPRPGADDVAERLARWSELIDLPQPSDHPPYYFAIDTPFPMSGAPADLQVLLDGWHEPEPWGRWTDGATASLQITLMEPTTELLTLELDVVPSAVAASLQVEWEDTMLGVIDPAPGLNVWDIPPELTAGESSFLVTLHAGETVCPARFGKSPDNRILGIGISAIRLRSRRSALCELNTFMPIKSGASLTGVLFSGWHMLEDWGCWTSKTEAVLRLIMSAPLQTTVRLELTITLPTTDTVLTLSVNDVALPPVIPITGINHWDLPPTVTCGQSELHVLLAVPALFRPKRKDRLTDDRELGIGLRGVRIVPVVPEFVVPGTPLRLTASAAIDAVLLEGWHPAEEWGCWSSQQNALLRLRFREPLSGSFRLEMDLAPPLVVTTLTLSVNDQALPEIVPTSGSNSWNLPQRLIERQRELLIGLHVSDMFRPTDIGHSADGRVLGVGVRWVMLHRLSGAVCPIDTVVRISSNPGGSAMLLAGWHPPEQWGCWSSGCDASMLLRFESPLQGAYRLDIEMMPPLLDLSVTLAIDDTVLDTVFVSNEPSEWILPRSCTDGRTEIVLHLQVLRPARPIDIIDSSDDRILGVGVRNFRLRPLADT